MKSPALARLEALVRAKGAPEDAAALAELNEAIARAEAARQAAEAANEAKTRFLISVSHEIRSPLNAIYGYAQLLERGDGQGALRAAQVIRRSSEHLSHLIEGLLDISQVESGTLRLSRDTIRLRDFCQSVVDMLDVQARAKGLSLELECSPALPQCVRGDQKRLRQVLINLISNAIKFTPRGSVRLGVHYRNEIATFEVIDTGIGIESEDLARIFEPFNRAGGSEAQPGIGLGLSITQALVHIMGGDIRVTSAPGKGSRFTVRLMLSQPHAAPAETDDRRSEAAGGMRRRILLVDDDAAHVVMVGEVLGTAGYETSIAETGAEALAILERRRPDLVLLDVSLGKESGWDIAAIIRERCGEDVKIIMLSGEVSQQDAAAAGRVADGFITKPFAFDRLLAAIADALGLAPKTANRAPAASLADSPALPPATLRRDAREHLAEVERLIRIGHVRGIESEIDCIAAADPGARALAEEMRSLLDAFDLAGLSDLVKGARVDGA